MPSIFGIMTSSTMHCGFQSRTRARPSAPSTAVRTAKPSCVSPASSISRMAASSSMTATRSIPCSTVTDHADLRWDFSGTVSQRPPGGYDRWMERKHARNGLDHAAHGARHAGRARAPRPPARPLGRRRRSPPASSRREMIAGPFFVDERLQPLGSSPPARAHGVPLRLATPRHAGRQPRLRAARRRAGRPLARRRRTARTPTQHRSTRSGRTFLRGYQVTGRDGAVAFTTIYPGWYRTRTPHLHVMVRTYSPSGNVTHRFTSQLFFDDAVNDAVFRRAGVCRARPARHDQRARRVLRPHAAHRGRAQRAHGYAGTLDARDERLAFARGDRGHLEARAEQQRSRAQKRARRIRPVENVT